MSHSDTDEENLEQFKESVDTQFLKENMFQNDEKRKNVDERDTQKLPSLRRNLHEEDESFNFFRVTAGFQKHVSKHLAARLDKDLDSQVITNVDNTSKKRKLKEGGVKLLKSSEHYLKIHKRSKPDESCYEHNTKVIQQSVEFDEEKLEKQCQTVAVEGNEIIQMKDVKFWSNRSKAEVFSYKEFDGVLEFQTPEFVPFKYK